MSLSLDTECPRTDRAVLRLTVGASIFRGTPEPSQNNKTTTFVIALVQPACCCKRDVAGHGRQMLVSVQKNLTNNPFECPLYFYYLKARVLMSSSLSPLTQSCHVDKTCNVCGPSAVKMQRAKLHTVLHAMGPLARDANQRPSG